MSRGIRGAIVRIQLVFILVLLLVACSFTKVSSSDEPISIYLNQKRVTLKKGVKLSRVKASSQLYLSLEIKDTIMVSDLAEGNTLQIILARGSRPVTSLQTQYDIPYRMGFVTDSLFNEAEVGDRLIFYTDDFIIYTLAIAR